MIIMIIIRETAPVSPSRDAVSDVGKDEYLPRGINGRT